MMSAKLLIAEDSEDDIYLFKKALEKAACVKPAHFVRDGTEAIEWLEELLMASAKRTNINDVILITDLKMPKLNGFELLKWVRSEARLSKIPVIIYSSSGLPTDMSMATKLGANRYFQKTTGFLDVIRFIEDLPAPVSRTCGGRHAE
jgi:CheY-like chemotaxis protein